MKVVIVGGVAGGASAAARIRRLDEHAQIIMIERSVYVSYANCGLPYYVGGVIKEQEELTLQTPESFWDRFRIDVRVRQEVTAINPAEKTVTVHALDSGKVYTETYDKLLLAPGAKPTVPALSGVSSERVFTLRTVEDTLRIRRFVEDQKPKTAVLAGGGFIGLEMAENLVEMGVSVTIVQRPKQLLAPLDADHVKRKQISLFSEMRIGDQHDNQQQCIQCRFVEERRLMPLPEFLYVNTIRKELEIWICDQISVSLLIHKIPPTPDGLSKNKAGNQRICKRPEGKLFDLAVNQYNSNTAEDASINGKPALIDLKNGEKVILVLLPLKKHIVCSGTENTHGNQPKHEII